MQLQGWPRVTMVNGHIVVRDGELLERGRGKPVRFIDVPAQPSGDK
jgi:hypothetical protein